jgi:hypothetical protein
MGRDTTRGAAGADVPAGAVGDPVGRLLMSRGARASPLVDLAVAGEDDEMVLPAALLSGAGVGGAGGSSGVT